jgi:hypothetical protein
MSGKCSPGKRNVKKTVSVTVAGKGRIKKEIALHQSTEENITRILKEREAALDALSKY